jgi:multiple sugar transport system substrate-binding protein
MRKNIRNLAILFLISIVGTAAACGNSNNFSNKQNILEGKITVVTDAKYIPQLTLASNNFKKLNPKVEINIKSQDDIHSNIENLSKNKNIDVLNVEDTEAQYIIGKSNGNLLDVTNDISAYKDRFSKSKMDNLNFKGKVYGFPWSSSPKILLYNKELFEKEGINVDDIKTWNDYVDIGNKIKADTGKKLTANIQDKSNNLYIILANELGTSYFNSSNNIDFGDKKWERVLSIVKLLYSGNLISDSKSYIDAVNSLKDGEIVSLIANPASINYLMSRFPKEKGKWAVAKLPAFESGGNEDSSVGGLDLLINKSTKNIKLSKEFTKFVATNEYTQMEELKNYGVFPAFSDVYNLVEFNKVIDYFGSRVWYIFSSSEEGALGIEYTPYFPYIDKATKNTFSKENIESYDIRGLLDYLQNQCETIIAKK